MSARKYQPAEHTSGAIDLMYFPPARLPSGPAANELRCREPIAPVVALKQQCGLDFVFVTQCKRCSCDRRIYCEDVQLDDVLRYTCPYPQHFIGIGGYNPLEISESTHRTEIGILRHGFRGIYVHPRSFGISLMDRRMYPLYVKALGWRVPVIVDVRRIAEDTHSTPVDEVAHVAGDFPDLTFVIAQSQWTSAEMLHLSESIANVYYCLDAPALFSGDTLEFLNSASGRSRCMWGSNGQPWKEALREITAQVQNPGRFLRDNAIHVFGLTHLRKRRAKPFLEPEQPPARIVAE